LKKETPLLIIKHVGFIILLLLVPILLRAQSVGEVRYGSEVFSTGLPANIDNYWDPETGVHLRMPKERRETAIECIEWTFGKVESYKESYNECQGYPVFEVILTNGDKLDFEDGCLGDYTIVSPRFLVAADMFEGGLRVGRKPNMKCRKGVVLRQNEQDPSRYDYWWEETEVYGHFTLDENGRIKEIGCWFNAC
jgi:hypothetical protein